MGRFARTCSSILLWLMDVVASSHSSMFLFHADFDDSCVYLRVYICPPRPSIYGPAPQKMIDDL